MANKVSFIIDLKDRFSRSANKIKSSVGGVTSKLDRLKRKLRQAGDGLAKFGRKAKSAGKSMASFGAKLTAGLTVPLAGLGIFALKQSASLETLGVAFETMTGSAEKGGKLLETITKFTATTPFQLEGVGQATKKLLAFQVSIEDMTPTLRQLGDIASGTDAPLADLAAIFGKAKAKGKLMTEEILQLSDRGIPIIKVLAETMNVSEDAIFDLASKSKLSFGLMQKAFDQMTSKGGVFFESTIKQSKTLAGRWSTLTDNINLVAGAIGDVIVRATGLKKVFATVADFLDKLKNKIAAFGEAQPEVTRLLVIFAGILAVLGPVVVVAGALVFAFGALLASVASLIAPLLVFSALVVALTVAWTGSGQAISDWITIAIEAISAFKDKVILSFSDMIESVFDFKDVVILAFSDMMTSVAAFGKSIIDFAVKPIQAVMDKFSSLKGLASRFIFGDTNTAPPIEINQPLASTSRSQTDIAISLRAPERVVESTKIKSTGNRNNLNVGMNMILEGA